jgi:hypothetical protein
MIDAECDEVERKTGGHDNARGGDETRPDPGTRWRVRQDD